MSQQQLIEKFIFLVFLSNTLCTEIHPYFKVYSTAHEGATRTSVQKRLSKIQQLAVVLQRHGEIIK